MSKHKDNRALTLIEMLFVFAIIVALIVLIPSQTTHKRSKRLICGSHLKMIGTSMMVYGNEYNLEHWAVPPFMSQYNHYDILPGEGDGSTMEPNRMTPAGTNGVHVSPTRVFWAFIRSGDMAPDMFIFPSSTDTAASAVNADRYYDFTIPGQISYGYNVSLLQRNVSPPPDDQYNNTSLSNLPVVADKSSYSQTNHTTPPASMNTSMLSSQWKPYNSSNHGGEGQNILYADGHFAFDKRPFDDNRCDNIYTTAASCTDRNPLLTGVSMWTARDLPYNWLDPKHNPYAATDSLIFP